MGKEFKYTEEQENIFDFIKHDCVSAVVNAFAGSGKTKTIVRGLECVLDKNAMFLAHNKSIQINLTNKITPILINHIKEQHPEFDDDAASKYLKSHNNIKIFTYHSLGLHLLIDYFISNDAFPDSLKNDYYNYKNKSGEYSEEYCPNAFVKFVEKLIDRTKYKKYINYNTSEIGGEEYNALSESLKKLYRKNLLSLVDLSRLNKCQSIKEVLKTSKKYGINCVANECDVVPEILDWGKTHLETVDFQDLLWLPYELKYGASKKYLSDIIFIDEAQDSSPLQQELLKKCLARGGRFIAVGDKNQTINSFCGSDAQSFKSIKKLQPNVKEFTLTTCFRCDKKILEHAIYETKKLEAKYNVTTTVELIKPREDAGDGEIVYNVLINDIEDGSLVICRNTAPLIKLYRELLRLGKNVQMVGDVSEMPFVTLLEGTESDTTEGAINEIKRYLIDVWRQYVEDMHDDTPESTYVPEIGAIYDQLKSIEYICEDFIFKQNAIDFIKDNNVSSGDSIKLSTIHKAKGLEADNVYMLSPSLMPSKLVREDQDWEKVSEANLMYVAITRAKHKFGYISEKEINPGIGFVNKNVRYNEFKEMEKSLNSLF